MTRCESLCDAAKPGMFFEVIFGSELVSLGPVQKKMKIDAVTVTCDL